MDGVKYISGFSRLGPRVTDLSRISSLLEALGRPQDALRFIHIAGTNGKGSIAQMLSEALTAAGYRTGLFTSPYILTFYDRIRLNGRNIPKKALDSLMSELKDTLEAHPLRNSLTQFEVTQAAAFVWFKRQKCDVVVLEAGLGGLLDSTNVIEAPLCSVIGSIGLDHTAVLGDTIEKIAEQKAGIIKPGCPCVLSAGAGESVLRIFRETAKEKGSLLTVPEKAQYSVSRSDITGSEFTYKGRFYETSMPGEHQVMNALTVIETLACLSKTLPVSYEHTLRGIAAASLPGRVEILSRSPLTILDGSHNPDGIAALTRFLKSLGERKIRAVIGMHTDKDAAEAIRLLSPLITEFYPVSGFSDRDIPAQELAKLAECSGSRAVLSEEPPEQLISRLQAEHPEDMTLICGSLYLVSYVKAAKTV